MVKKALPSKVKKKDKEVAARVTSNDDKLKMNNKSAASGKTTHSSPGKQKPVPKAAVTSDANVERAKYVKSDVSKRLSEKPRTLQQVIEELAKQKKTVISSRMSRTDYLRFKKSMDYGRMKGVPTPVLAFAYYDLTEIRTVHNVFGMKVVALNPRKPQTVVEIAGISTGNPYCQKIEHFNGQAYSNRIYRRTEPFFAKFLPEARRLLNDQSAILISMTPANSDAYFRYKVMEVIKRNGYDPKDVATVIGRFYKTSFNAMILVIEKLQMKDGVIKEVKDFEYEKIKGFPG